MTLWYEQMTKDPELNITNLASFLDISLEPSRAVAIQHACSFDSMKSAQLKHGTRLSGTLIEPDIDNDGSKDKVCRNHIRKGGIGGWRSYLSEVQSHTIDDIVKEKCSEYGIEISIDYG